MRSNVLQCSLAARYAKPIMATTIEDVAKALGVSVRGVRLRVDALREIIDAHLRQGENNRLLFDGEALAILRRLEELRNATGITIRQAASQVREELDPNKTNKQSQSTSQPASRDALAVENQLLRQQVERLEEEVRWLRSRVDTLTPLALPRPRRWFGWLHPRRRYKGNAFEGIHGLLRRLLWTQTDT